MISCPLLTCGWTYVLPPVTAASGALGTLLGTEVTISDPKRIERDLEAHCKTHAYTEWAAAVVELQAAVMDAETEAQMLQSHVESQREVIATYQETHELLKAELKARSSAPAQSSAPRRASQAPEEREPGRAPSQGPRLARGAAAEAVTPLYSDQLPAGIVGIKTR